MTRTKDEMIRHMQRKAEKKAAKLAGKFARAPSPEKEEMLAALEIEKWKVESCRQCLEQD